jgi:hypothetical protein
LAGGIDHSISQAIIDWGHRRYSIGQFVEGLNLSMSRGCFQSGIQLVSRLIDSAARGLFKCLIIAMTLAATSAAPAVAEVLLSEAESPLETDEEAGIEAALPGSPLQESHRRGRDADSHLCQRDCARQTGHRLPGLLYVGGHRLANGLLAPLRC